MGDKMKGRQRVKYGTFDLRYWLGESFPPSVVVTRLLRHGLSLNSYSIHMGYTDDL